MAKKRKPRRATPADSAPEPARRNTPPAAPVSTAGAPPRPPPSVWWLALAVVAVIAIVAMVRMREGGDGSLADGDDGGTELVDEDEDSGPEHDAAGTDAGPRRPERLRVSVLHSFPHDRGAFTQGLLWYEGHLYESTGLYGDSTVREVDLESGDVLRSRDVERRIFAEGLARVGERLYQISWMEHRAQVWNLADFEPVQTFEYEGEGWGLCYDGEHLVMSDGSDALVFRDPVTFAVVRTVHVTERGEPIDQLNELECVDGAVWSNVWQTDRILRIDPTDGRVTGIVDARGLLTGAESRGADVLNGIAWIPERGHFVITGKRWPRLFEVDFVPATSH